ncbi:hypothetical protein [Reichenbachiella versicolor]|uniref:hypothetical protein n=1 Tax=Reichenbachiella versicolor TaxID=1821036 RepID=UPI000D6E6A1F|nr:hypothetical protein [Reichenbachiella versicolor]
MKVEQEVSDILMEDLKSTYSSHFNLLDIMTVPNSKLIEELKVIYSQHLALINIATAPSTASVDLYADLRKDIEKKLKFYESIEDPNNIDIDELMKG